MATLLFGLIVLFGPRLDAQTLQMQVDPLPGGKGGSILLNLVTASGTEPVALQWEFSFPDSIALDFRGAKVEAAAGKAQKSIRCELLPNRQGKTQTCRCIVAGGSTPVPSGSFAAITYSGSRTFKPGRYALQIKKAVAITGDLRKISIKDSQVDVAVAK